MPNNKKHHYVPKFYMKNFADNNEMFYVYNIGADKDCGLVPFKSQCYRDYLYGKDPEFEKKLGAKEQKWSDVLGKIIRSDPLNDKDIYLIKEFAIYQRERTEIEFNHNIKSYVDSSAELVKTHCYYKKIPYDDSVCKELIEERAKTSFNQLGILEKIDRYLCLIDDLSCQIIEFKNTQKLISSDSPVIIINPFHPDMGLGPACAGLIILFPVSETKLVVIYDGNMYNNPFTSRYYISTNDNDITILNNLQYISANKILFSSDDFSMFKIDESLTVCRKNSQDSSEIQTLGPEGHKIVMHPSRKTLFDGELSFIRLPRKIKRIPLTCRDGFWRFDIHGKWEEKLKIKWKILSKIYQLSDTMEKANLTKKDCKLGCERMYIEAKKHWQKSKSVVDVEVEAIIKELEDDNNQVSP